MLSDELEQRSRKFGRQVVRAERIPGSIAYDNDILRRVIGEPCTCGKAVLYADGVDLGPVDRAIDERVGRADEPRLSQPLVVGLCFRQGLGSPRRIGMRGKRRSIAEVANGEGEP